VALLGGCNKEPQAAPEASAEPQAPSQGASAKDPSARDTTRPEADGSAQPIADDKATPLKPGDSLWLGKIGGAEVVVTLRVKEGKVGGVYYYRKHRRSLVLTGTIKEGKLSLDEQGGGADKIFGPKVAKLSLTHVDGRLEGEWSPLAEGAKPQKIALKRDLKGDYDDYRAVSAPLVHAEGGRFDTITTTHLHEHLVYCKTKSKPPVELALIPQMKVIDGECHFAFEGELGKRIIVEGTGVGVRNAKSGINQDDTNRRVAPTMEYDVGETWEGKYAAEVAYAGGHLLSIEYTTSGLGLGAYPDHNQYVKTYDLRTGEAVAWEDILQDPGSTKFRAALLDWAKKKNQREECNWEALWDDNAKEPPLWPHLTPQGLHVTPQFPHADKACQYEAFGLVVPKKTVKKFAKDSGILSEIFAGSWGMPK
jgi:hypothetical protein